MKVFKEFWSENGDYISFQYAGSSTTTHVTNGGTEGGVPEILNHKFICPSKYYIGKFKDEKKQKALEVFLKTTIIKSIIFLSLT